MGIYHYGLFYFKCARYACRRRGSSSPQSHPLSHHPTIPVFYLPLLHFIIIVPHTHTPSPALVISLLSYYPANQPTSVTWFNPTIQKLKRQIITNRHLISPRLAHWHGIKNKRQTKVVDAPPYHHHPPGTHKNSAPISSSVPGIILGHLDSIYIVPILTIFSIFFFFFLLHSSVLFTPFASVPCIHSLSLILSLTPRLPPLPIPIQHLDLTTLSNNQFHIDFLTRSQIEV